MKAMAAVPGKHEPVWVNIPEPGAPGPGWIRCRTARLGVSDLDRQWLASGGLTPPAGESFVILGHQVLAWVDDVGPGVDGFMVGDSVVPLPRHTVATAQVFPLRADDNSMGRRAGLFHQHGYATEFWLEPAANLQLVPDYLRDIAILTEPFALAETALNEAQQLRDIRLELYQERDAAIDAETGGRLLCLGDTLASFAAAGVGRLQDLEVWLLGLEAPRSPLAKLAGDLGLTYWNASRVPWSEFQKPARGFDILIETSPDLGVWREAIRTLNQRGVISLAAQLTACAPSSLDGHFLWEVITRRNLAVAGSANAPRDFSATAEVLRQLKLRYPSVWPRLITAEYSLPDALQAWRPRGSRDLQTVINFGRV